MKYEPLVIEEKWQKKWEYRWLSHFRTHWKGVAGEWIRPWFAQWCKNTF